MSERRGLWQRRLFLISPFSISTSPVPALPRSPRSSLGGGCRSFLSAGMDQRADQKRSLNDQRCKSRCRYQSSARQLTRSSRPLVRHRPALTTLRRIFNEPHRPPHHHVHSADRGARAGLEFALSTIGSLVSCPNHNCILASFIDAAAPIQDS